VSAEYDPDREFWPFWKLAVIALPQMGVMVMWIFLGPHTSPYLQLLGASQKFSVENNSAGPVIGFLVGPVIGTWSDQSTSKYGRRRPLIAFGLVMTVVAGVLYSGAGAVIKGKCNVGGCDTSMYLAASMQWGLDFTVNVMQTPFRALVADLAAPEQQMTMQIFFAVVCAVGQFLAFTIMKMVTFPVKNMFFLMSIVLVINVLCCAACFSVAKEKQHVRQGSESSSICAPIYGMAGAFKGMQWHFYMLMFVQCVVWMGNNVWSQYGKMWFMEGVYDGNSSAINNSASVDRAAAGAEAFETTGQIGSLVNLLLAFLLMGLTKLDDGTGVTNLIYAPCIFIGAAVCALAGFVVGHNGTLAMITILLSNITMSACGALPYGIVALWNAAAEKKGKAGSVAMQMAILNCCITVGQQASTMVLGGFTCPKAPSNHWGGCTPKALNSLFIISMAANLVGGVVSLPVLIFGRVKLEEPSASVENMEMAGLNTK